MTKKQYLYSNLFAWSLVLFLIANHIFGWTIPSQDPPGGNIVLETGATPAGSTGYIQFNDSGNLGADSNLFWDNTNKYLGIGTMSPGAKLDLNLSSGIGFQVKYIGVSSGAYKKSVILLHEIYDDTAIGGNNVVGKIFASRGSAGAFNRKSFADVVSGSAYTNTFATVQSTGEEWILKTCYYNGKKYIALDVPFNNAQYSEGFFFEGFYKSTGESLLLVDYYCTNTDSCGGPVLNSEINNSLTDYTEKRNLWFSGNIIASTPTADNHVATKAYVDSVVVLDDFTCGDNVTFVYNGKRVTYGTIESQGKCWMDRNLGALRVATAYDDSLAYGDLFQWGRLDDGHQIRTRGTTSTLSSTDDPGHSNFITNGSSPYDWRSSRNDNLWQGVSGTNNPCPSGWRIPTSAEWQNEYASWSQQNYSGAFASPLKLTAGGSRAQTGTIQKVGLECNYWTSTRDGSYSKRLVVSSSAVNLYGRQRATSGSVRCLKD